MKLQEFHIGDVFVTEDITMTEEEIIDFAEKYDPQYFHIDKEAAEHALFGQLVASGMHSMALINAAFVRLHILGTDIQGGVHFDARWLQPVYAGDVIYGEYVVAQVKARSNSRTGALVFDLTGKKSTGETFAKATLEVLMLQIL